MNVRRDETALLADELSLHDLVPGLHQTLRRRAEVLAHGNDERPGKRNRLDGLVAGQILVVLGMDAAVELET